tara:strand:+ start:6360 stop:6674 length:315 start_codon:yes stop_codon:yes gene_type:complete
MKVPDKNLCKVTYNIYKNWSKQLKRYMYRIEINYKSIYGYIQLEVIEDIIYKKQADKLVNLLKNNKWEKEILIGEQKCIESRVRELNYYNEDYKWQDENLRYTY